jgi:hypothetical protein
VRDLLSAGVGLDAVNHLLRMVDVRLSDAHRVAEAVAPVQVVGAALTRGPLAALFSVFRGEANRAKTERASAEMRAVLEHDIETWERGWSADPRIPSHGTPRTGPINDDELQTASDEQLARIAAGEPAEMLLGNMREN